ncbi:hypothetical protein Bbelb_243190 [Branchiostoma belcheri]|nr:hypothetical protein Bbelb_243190 [Branchiostoma belcheri]
METPVIIRCDLSPEVLEGGTHTTVPPDIVPTSLVPDITIQNTAEQTLTLIELTVPFEQNTQTAVDRKLARYEHLKEEINSQSRYRAMMVTIEVGSRGWVNSDNVRKLKSLCPVRRKDSEVRELKRKLGHSALCTSYAIYCARNTPVWESPPGLFSVR